MSLLRSAWSFTKENGVRETLRFASLNASSELYHRKLGTRDYNNSGINVLSKDWDNLLILDACRYDYFSDHEDRYEGELQKQQSKGSATKEFVSANFANKSCSDLVIVTANGWYIKLKDEIGFECHSIYDCWDNQPTAERVTQAAKECAERYPNKRLLIHYIPPHHPYIGNTASKYLPDYQSQLNESMFSKVRNGNIDISREVIRRCYRENLERGLEQIDEILPALSGKTVITADHGEMLGEYVSPVPLRWYGHPPGTYTNELINVPWFVIPHDRRKEIEDGECNTNINREFARQERKQDAINERLRDLGYKM